MALDKNIPVTVVIKALDWDYLNNDFKKGSETNFTGNIKFVAYNGKDLVYDDRFSIKLGNKATKEDYFKQVKELKSFFDSSLSSLKNMYHRSYKPDIEEVSEEECEKLVQKVNQLYTRWPSLFIINSNFMNPDEDPIYSGSFMLMIYEKSKIGLYEKHITKVKVKFSIDEFNTYEEFSEKMDVMCNRWDTFRKVSEKDKKEVYLKLS